MRSSYGAPSQIAVGPDVRGLNKVTRPQLAPLPDIIGMVWYGMVRVPESMECQEQCSRTNDFSSDKVSENLSEDFSKDNHILDKLSNDDDIFDKLPNDYNILYK